MIIERNIVKASCPSRIDFTGGFTDVIPFRATQWVNTESNRKEITEWAIKENRFLEEKMEEIAKPLTLHRFIEPEEVANLVTFLIKPAGSGITGQVYEIK